MPPSTASRAACHSPIPVSSTRSPSSEKAVVLPGRASVAGCPPGLDQAIALQSAEERIDRPFPDDGQASSPESLGHLVAIRRSFAHHRQETEVEDAAKQLAPPPLRISHAPQATVRYRAPQGTPGTELCRQCSDPGGLRPHEGANEGADEKDDFESHVRGAPRDCRPRRKISG